VYFVEHRVFPYMANGSYPLYILLNGVFSRDASLTGMGSAVGCSIVICIGGSPPRRFPHSVNVVALRIVFLLKKQNGALLFPLRVHVLRVLVRGQTV
jgi:hypothetical protein